MIEHVKVGEGKSQVVIGSGHPLAVIAGPCVIESRDHILRHAAFLKETAEAQKLPLIFKASYDKANRTSEKSFRGVGIEEGLAILEEVKREFAVPVISDVHNEEEAAIAAGVLDVLQVPAFLCRQTSLLKAVGAQKKPVLIKKGQFLAPEDMKFCVAKVIAGGSNQVMACERGVCFGYRDLVVDFKALKIMSEYCPVVFDATHAVQSMGGANGVSGGNRNYVSLLARAAVAVGVDAVFLECHENPDAAPSDGPNMLSLESVPHVLADLKALSELTLLTR